MKIFHWLKFNTLVCALDRDALAARRWAHFLEREQRFAKGTSWGLDATRWQSDFSFCLVAENTKISNVQHSIAANRTYLLTQAIINPVCDPNCWLQESEEIDEVFIEGRISRLTGAIDHILYRDGCDLAKLAQLNSKASLLGLRILNKSLTD